MKLASSSTTSPQPACPCSVSLCYHGCSTVSSLSVPGRQAGHDAHAAHGTGLCRAHEAIWPRARMGFQSQKHPMWRASDAPPKPAPGLSCPDLLLWHWLLTQVAGAGGGGTALGELFETLPRPSPRHRCTKCRAGESEPKGPQRAMKLGSSGEPLGCL